MASETRDFEAWLASLARRTDGLPLRQALDLTARSALAEPGVRIWFAQILGERWSYIAGETAQEPSEASVKRIELTPGLGLLSDTWERLGPHEQRKLVALLQGLCTADTEKHGG